mgnify:FL=1
MKTFYILDENRIQNRHFLQYKGEVKAIACDFQSWAEDNGTVTGITWSVENGDASISNVAMVSSSNVGSANITTSEAGNSMIKALATDGTNKRAVYFQVKARDPQIYSAIPDYGLATY